MATDPADRQQAIDLMARLLQQNGADPETAVKGATMLVDEAIRNNGE